MIALTLALMGACFKPLPDPLAEQRAGLADLLSAPLPVNWPAQASIVVGRAPVDAAVTEAIAEALSKAVRPVEVDLFLFVATVTPQVEVRGARVTASEDCVSCLMLELDLAGNTGVVLSNSSGTRAEQVGWTGTLRGAMALALDAESGQLSATLAAPESWGADFETDSLPPGWNKALSGSLDKTLRSQIDRPDIAPIPLVRLQDDGPVGLKGLRVRPASLGGATDGGVAMDFAFALTDAGEVTALPDSADGWAVVFPERTVFGLLESAVLAEPYDPEQPITPELLGVTLSEAGFSMDVRAWPTKGRAKPRDVRVFGTIALDEAGDIQVEADRAEWIAEEGAGPDLMTLLMGKRVLDRLAGALKATMPATQEQTMGGVVLSATTTELVVEDGVIRLAGVMERQRE